MANIDRPSKATSPFAPFLERRSLRRLAGGVSFERGGDYFGDGPVKALKENDLMIRLGRKTEFTTYLGAVRAAHKAKRNFIKLLDWEKL